MSSRDRSDESSPSLRRTLLGVTAPARPDSSAPVLLTPPNGESAGPEASALSGPGVSGPGVDDRRRGTEPMSRPVPPLLAEPTARPPKTQVDEPIPNPARSLGRSNSMTEPLLTPRQPARSHDPRALFVREPRSRAPTSGVGDGPIRVVCRRCDRSVWGWKLPFGVSCPIESHHAHLSWWMVGVVASFWTIVVVLVIALVAIVAG